MHPRCYPNEESKFNDNAITSLETRIAQTLWRWKDAAVPKRDTIVVNDKLGLMLEHWFPFGDIPMTRKLGTWCDGISSLEVSSSSRLSFLLAGVGWFPTYLAPFEVEFHFPQRFDTTTISIVLRLGFRDRLFAANFHGTPSANDDVTAFASRPRNNRDWALAVELTETGE